MKKVFTFVLVIVLLNGALFNRIGFRMAEQSYIMVLANIVLGVGEHQPHIKISKRILPGQASGSQSIQKDFQQVLINQCGHLGFSVLRSLQTKMLYQDINIPVMNTVVIKLIKPPI